MPTTTSSAKGITEASFDGLSAGMIPGFPPHEIPDNAARIIVDAFVHNPGLVMRRGPVTRLQGFPALTYPACGLASVVDPTGQTRVGALHGDATHGYLGVWSVDQTTRTDLPLGVNLPQTPYQIVRTGARMRGGVYITIQDKTTQGANQYLILWKGSGSLAYTTGTATTTRGSTTVTGAGTAWMSSVQAGAFLFADSKYVGCVKTVASDGGLVLEDAALVTTAAVAYSVQPFRGINPRVGKGYITTSTASVTVNGANTKFAADGLGTGTWDIFRSSDYTYIGTVATVVSDIQFTLVSNAALNLDQEPYTAIQRDGTYSISPTSLGVITSMWGGRQVYANNGSKMEATSRMDFSSVDDAEAIDQATKDGDRIQVPSIGPAGTATSIVALEATDASLLVLKENEVYGLFGQTSAQFQIMPVMVDDGCLSPMSVQQWNGTVLFAGRQGIYAYDGQTATNITTNTLGWWYQTAVASFDATKYRMWSMIDRDHYFLYVEQAVPPIPVVKGATPVAMPSFTISVHLPTQAVTVHRNLHIRGSLRLPSALGHSTWYLVTNASSQGVLCSADVLFDSVGNDDFGCDGGTAGPDFYLETKKYTFGDPLLKKLWKMLLLSYMVVGDQIVLDTVPGLNEQGTASVTKFPVSGLTWEAMAALNLTWAGSTTYPMWASPVGSQFITKRIRFLKRSQMMSFRLYQNSSSVKALTLGPWSLVVKPQRIGRP